MIAFLKVLSVLLIAHTAWSMDCIKRDKAKREHQAASITKQFEDCITQVKSSSDCYGLLNFPYISMVSLIKDTKFDGPFDPTSPLVRAALFRDPEEIARVVKHCYFVDIEKDYGRYGENKEDNLNRNIDYAIAITLDFGDMSNFYGLLDSPVIKERVLATKLPLQFAIFSGDIELFNKLMSSGLMFNVNQPCAEDYITDWFELTVVNIKNDRSTLLDIMNARSLHLKERIGESSFSQMHKILVEEKLQNDYSRSGMINYIAQQLS